MLNHSAWIHINSKPQSKMLIVSCEISYYLVITTMCSMHAALEDFPETITSPECGGVCNYRDFNIAV